MSRIGFKNLICLLIAPVPVHCFSITVLHVCAYTGPRYQVSDYRTIGPLVALIIKYSKSHRINNVMHKLCQNVFSANN